MPKTIDMILEYEQEAANAYRDWRKHAKQELDYCLNYQWKPKDKQAVEKEGRPALTFNEIQPIMRLVSGYQRQNRKDIKVVGVEGGDEFIAHIMTLLIKNVMTRSYGEFKISQMFMSGIRTSKGWIEPDISYYEDPISGLIKLKNDLYYQVYPDPDYTEYSTEDAEYLLKHLKMTKSKLQQLFPEHGGLLSKLSKVESPFDEITQVEDDPDTGYEQEVDGTHAPPEPFTRAERRALYNLTVCWYKKYEKKLYIVDIPGGEVKDITDNKLSVRDQKSMLQTVNRGQENIAFIHQQVPVPWVALKSGKELISDSISPLWPHVKTFPLVPYVAAFTPEANSTQKVFQGLGRALIDPQNEINKRSSQRLALINAMANSVWIGDDDAFTAPDWKHFEDNASVPGAIFKKKKGSELKREYPVNAGQMHNILIDDGSQRLKSISGVNADLLAQQDKTASGRALAIRQAQGIMVIQDVFDNLKYSRDILGRLLIGMILNSYTPEKIVRICGEKRQVQDPATGQAQEIGEINYNEARQVLDEFDMLQYDLAVDETQMSPVMRMAVGEELLALRDKLPSLQTGIADDLIVDATSIPNKEEIKSRIQMAMQQAQGQQGGQS